MKPAAGYATASTRATTEGVQAGKDQHKAGDDAQTKQNSTSTHSQTLSMDTMSGMATAVASFQAKLLTTTSA